MDAIIARHAPPRFRWLRLIGRTVVIVLLVLILLAGAGELLEPPFRLLFGWLFHLRNVLPALSWSLETILCSLGALLLGVSGLHLLMPRLFGRAWPLRWSVAWCGLLTLLFATSIAAVGIVHQTGWLFRVTWFEYPFSTHVQGSILNAHQVILLCKGFAKEHEGRWPDSLDELIQPGGLMTERLFFSQVNRRIAPEPWVYLGAGRRDDDDPSTPILISPQATPESPIVVGWLNGSTDYIAKPQEIQKIMERLQKPPASKQE
jgi:hypothetical protein